MGWDEEKYGLEHLLGKTNLPRIVYPTLRGSVRRSDPDGGNASPYFPSLSGKTLSISCSPIGTSVVNFTSDDMDQAIADINAVSPANLQALDDDGYLRIKNLNAGGTNSISIVGGTALDILGFVAVPEPGSKSYAGDLETSSPGRGLLAQQDNPQGTALIASDEDLTSSVLNRGIYGLAHALFRQVRDLDIEVPIVFKQQVTVVTHAATGKKVFVYQSTPASEKRRFPIVGYGIGANPQGTELFDKLVTIRTFPGDLEVIDATQTNPFARVKAVYYNDATVATADNTSTFSTYGVMDGKTIFGGQGKNKQAPVNITAIRGNIIVASTALFSTNGCQPGDTLVVESATNTSPFSHNGEFIIVSIISETKVQVRPKASHEPTFVSGFRPTELNTNHPGGTSFGTVRVIVGNTFPLSGPLMFEVDSWVPLGSYYARFLCFKPIRELSAGDLGDVLYPGNAGLGALLNTHFTGPSAHASSNITAVAVPGSPYSLLSGTVASQTAAVIGILNTLIAANIAYGGGGAWANGTTNPATTVEAQLDKIISDLAAAVAPDGAIKIGAAAVTDLAAGTVRSQLNALAVGWGKLDRVNTWIETQTFDDGIATPSITHPNGAGDGAGGGDTINIFNNISVLGDVTATHNVVAQGDIKYGTDHSKVVYPAMGAYTTIGEGYILGIASSIDADSGSSAGSGVWQLTAVGGGSPAGACRQHMCLEAGSRCIKAKIVFTKTSGGDISIGINRFQANSGMHSNLESFTPVGQIVGDNTVTCTLASPFTVGTDEDISIDINVAAVGDKLRSISIYWDRP